MISVLKQGSSFLIPLMYKLFFGPAYEILYTTNPIIYAEYA